MRGRVRCIKKRMDGGMGPVKEFPVSEISVFSDIDMAAICTMGSHAFTDFEPSPYNGEIVFQVSDRGNVDKLDLITPPSLKGDGIVGHYHLLVPPTKYTPWIGCPAGYQLDSYVKPYLDLGTSQGSSKATEKIHLKKNLKLKKMKNKGKNKRQNQNSVEAMEE